MKASEDFNERGALLRAQEVYLKSFLNDSHLVSGGLAAIQTGG
jgi:hypothetical protein